MLLALGVNVFDAEIGRLQAATRCALFASVYKRSVEERDRESVISKFERIPAFRVRTERDRVCDIDRSDLCGRHWGAKRLRRAHGQSLHKHCKHRAFKRFVA